MFAFLKNHPFAVNAFFEKSLVLTFAVPKRELQQFIPECLLLDTFKQEWGFIAVAMVQTKNLRPKGFPAWAGSNFFLIGYRIFVRYTNIAGKNLRGLYILKSETDKRSMQFAGNTFTHYNYSTTDISQNQQNNLIEISSVKSNFQLTVLKQQENVSLPIDSPFSDWKEARRFAGPLPFTFTYIQSTGQVLIIEGLRENWEPKPIKVMEYNFGYLNSLGFKKVVLANAFIVENIPYTWKKGKTETWKQSERNFKAY